MVTAVTSVEDPELTIDPAAPELDDAGRALVESNVNLVRWWSRRYFHRATQSGIDPDDVEQEAQLGLVEAAARFRPELGTKFSAFARPFIRGHICRLFEGRKRSPRTFDPLAYQASKDVHDRVRDRDFSDRSEGAPRPSRIFLDVDRHEEDRLERLRTALAGLPEFNAAVAAARFGLHGGEPGTLLEIAHRMGRGVGTIRKIIDNSLATLREEIEAAEDDGP